MRGLEDENKIFYVVLTCHMCDMFTDSFFAVATVPFYGQKVK